MGMYRGTLLWPNKPSSRKDKLDSNKVAKQFSEKTHL